MYFDGQHQPHCLSRGFSKGPELSALAELIRPEVLEDLMKALTFEGFAPELERRAHRFISRSIRGDFSTYTGPYDSSFVPVLTPRYFSVKTLRRPRLLPAPRQSRPALVPVAAAQRGAARQRLQRERE